VKKKPYSQETAQNFEKLVLQNCLRIAFYTYIPVNLYNFLKKHHNRCTLFFSQFLVIKALDQDSDFVSSLKRWIRIRSRTKLQLEMGICFQQLKNKADPGPLDSGMDRNTT
jgi:hypothetical protein